MPAASFRGLRRWPVWLRIALGLVAAAAIVWFVWRRLGAGSGPPAADESDWRTVEFEGLILDAPMPIPEDATPGGSDAEVAVRKMVMRRAERSKGQFQLVATCVPMPKGEWRMPLTSMGSFAVPASKTGESISVDVVDHPAADGKASISRYSSGASSPRARSLNLTFYRGDFMYGFAVLWEGDRASADAERIVASVRAP
ncbi:MAG: hypothetical protein HMLKMBBP_01956 [Planctomycetes bacterium]|nr:hypothetical protein [Planctomycetota bacterium]